MAASIRRLRTWNLHLLPLALPAIGLSQRRHGMILFMHVHGEWLSACVSHLSRPHLRPAGGSVVHAQVLPRQPLHSPHIAASFKGMHLLSRKSLFAEYAVQQSANLFSQCVVLPS